MGDDGDILGTDAPVGVVAPSPSPDDAAAAGPTVDPAVRDWRWPLGVAVLHAVLFAPVAISALFRPWVLFPNLWLWHAARIPETFRTPTEPIQPHLGWPGLSRLLDLVLPGSDPRVAGAIVSILASAFFGAVLYLVLRQDDDRRPLLSPVVAAVGSVVIALLENPAAIQGWQAVADPDRAFLPLYYSFVPTTLAGMGFNVLLVWMTSLLVTGRLGPTGRRWLPAVVIATAIAKPNVVPMLAAVALPAAFIWSTLRDRRDAGPARPAATAVREVLLLVVLPAAVISVVQYAILAWFSPPALLGGVAVKPFYEMRLLGGFGWQFWLVLVLPIVAIVLLRGRLLADAAVAMCTGCVVIGIVASLLIARTGETVYQGEVGGDILQMASAATVVLIVFLLRRLAVLRARGELSTAVGVVCLVLVVPYLVAGLDTYRCHAGISECYPRELAPTWPQPGIDDPYPDITRD